MDSLYSLYYNIFFVVLCKSMKGTNKADVVVAGLSLCFNPVFAIFQD